eukprot:scpid38635/ scgid30905/ 
MCTEFVQNGFFANIKCSSCSGQVSYLTAGTMWTHDTTALPVPGCASNKQQCQPPPTVLVQIRYDQTAVSALQMVDQKGESTMPVPFSGTLMTCCSLLQRCATFVLCRNPTPIIRPCSRT